jgi:curved DNA-binding protein CbpA
MVKDYYAILQLPPHSSIEEVKKAYRKLAKLYHPDLQKTSSNTILLQELYEAYHVLSNPSKKEHYDVFYHSKTPKLKSFEEQQRFENHQNNYRTALAEQQEAQKKAWKQELLFRILTLLALLTSVIFALYN